MADCQDAARLKRLANAVRDMDAQTRDIFLLHRIERLDYRQIANRIGISVDDVERHVADAMIALDRAAWPAGAS